MANCRACGALITWVKMASGKSMPCDHKLETFIILDVNKGIGHTIKGYVPHWHTCPNGDQFRKGRKEK